MARIRALGPPSFHSRLALSIDGVGCRIGRGERPEADGSMVRAIVARLGLPLSEAASAAIGEKIQAVLDNPGPAYEIDPATGALAALHCTS